MTRSCVEGGGCRWKDDIDIVRNSKAKPRRVETKGRDDLNWSVASGGGRPVGDRVLGYQRLTCPIPQLLPEGDNSASPCGYCSWRASCQPSQRRCQPPTASTRLSLSTLSPTESSRCCSSSPPTLPRPQRALLCVSCSLHRYPHRSQVLTLTYSGQSHHYLTPPSLLLPLEHNNVSELTVSFVAGQWDQRRSGEAGPLHYESGGGGGEVRGWLKSNGDKAECVAKPHSGGRELRADLT